MNYFQVCNAPLTLLYQCFIEPGITDCFVAWFGFQHLVNKIRLVKLVKVTEEQQAPASGHLL